MEFAFPHTKHPLYQVSSCYVGFVESFLTFIVCGYKQDIWYWNSTLMKNYGAEFLGCHNSGGIPWNNLKALWPMKKIPLCWKLYMFHTFKNSGSVIFDKTLEKRPHFGMGLSWTSQQANDIAWHLWYSLYVEFFENDL